MEAVTLWRPVDPVELGLIKQSGMKVFPPHLPDQPIFYPVLSEDYAIRLECRPGRRWLRVASP